MNTDSGFYKLDPESNELLYGPNAIYGPGFTLLKENYDEYTYPVDGWTWFDSENEAKIANNILT